MSVPRTPRRNSSENRSTRPRQTPKISPVSRSPSRGGGNELIELTVNSVMEGVPETRVTVTKGSTIGEVKTIISEVTDVLPEKMILMYKHKELKGDNNPIAQYGITEDCEITMNIKMNTGSRITRPNSVLYIPPAFPQGSVAELRSKIKSMTNVRGSIKIRLPRKARSPVDKKHSEWTPEKQMEHEITRNRMKRLMRRKRKKILSDSPPSSVGSVESRSAMDCSPSVSSTELRSDKSSISASNAIGISESAIKAFFEPPETVIEMELRKKHFLLAPSNMEELNAVKARREALLKTVCKVCNGKLKPAEQQMPCACSYVFCKHHRKPDTHLCNIDHRQMGRSKISKENPKMVFGGIRKAKMTPHP